MQRDSHPSSESSHSASVDAYRDPFIFGDWQVTPADNSVVGDAKSKTLEPRAMDVLVRLCQQPGEVVSADELLETCWGSVPMGDNPVHKAINQLRRALGDVASNPSYIETIRKRGYRTLAPVQRLVADQAPKATWNEGSPFAGLSAFGPNQADVFYGRNQQINTLLERVERQVEFGRAFCLVLGRSGSGKSSLIQAGLLPALGRPGGYKGIRGVSVSAVDLADVNDEHFWLDIASALLDWDVDDQPVFDGFSADQLAGLLNVDESNEEGLNPVLQYCEQAVVSQRQDGQRPLLVFFIDRLEVLLADDRLSDETRQRFIHLITELSDSGSVLVLSACRNDFYPQLARHSALMAGKASGAHFDLEPPSRAEIMDMIRLPAQAAGLSWELDPETGSSLDELIGAQASAGDDALPMLQYTLQELYLQRENDQLSINTYKAMGGLEGALSQKAETMMAQLSEAAQSSLPRILSLLINLGVDETSITSRTARWSELTTEAENELVQALVDERLFVSHIMNGDPSFSVAHEALLRNWPRALEWIEQHRDSLKTKARLGQLAQRWKEEGTSKSYLLAEGKPLQEAQALQNNPLFELAPLERAFVAQSSQRARRKQWGRSLVAAALVGLTLTSLWMTQQSKQAQELALQKRIEAESLLGFMVGDFAEKLRTVGRMDLLDGISNKALEYFASSDDSNTGLNFTARHQHAQTMEAIGEVALSRGKPEEAQEALTLAQSMFQKLLQEQPQNFELLKQLGANAFWLSAIPYESGDYARAEHYVIQYLDYSERMYQLQPDNLDSIQELSYANNTLGSLAQRRHDFDQAHAYFEKSLALKLQALEQLPDDVLMLTDLASTYSWLASAALSVGDARASMKYLQQEQSALEQVMQLDHQNAQADFERALSHYRQALLLHYQGRFDHARDSASRSRTLLIQLQRADPDNRQWLITAKRVQVLLTRIDAGVDPALVSASDLQELDRVQGFVTSAMEQSDAAQPQGLLSLLLELNESRQLLGHWTESQRLHVWLESQIALVENTDHSAQLLQVGRLLSAAALAQQQGLAAETSAHCQHALSLAEPLSHQSSAPDTLVPYARALDCLQQGPQGDLQLRLAKLDIPDVVF